MIAGFLADVKIKLKISLLLFVAVFKTEMPECCPETRRGSRPEVGVLRSTCLPDVEGTQVDRSNQGPAVLASFYSFLQQSHLEFHGCCLQVGKS